MSKVEQQAHHLELMPDGPRPPMLSEVRDRPPHLETQAELDQHDAVRQLAEALDRAQYAWYKMPHGARRTILESAEANTGDLHLKVGVPLDLLKALVYLVLTDQVMPLSLLIGPLAERTSLERETYRRAVANAESDANMTREAFRDLRDDVSEAMGSDRRLTLTQLFDHLHGLVQDRARLQALGHCSSLERLPDEWVVQADDGHLIIPHKNLHDRSDIREVADVVMQWLRVD